MSDDAGSVTFWLSIGDAQLSRGQAYLARKSYEVAAGIAPNDPEISRRVQQARELEEQRRSRHIQESYQRTGARTRLPPQLRALYRIEASQNMRSVLEHGLLSRNHVIELGLSHVDVSWRTVQARRAPRIIENGRGAHDYVPLFFCWDTPMNYVVRDVVILEISPEVLDKDGVYVADGNIASASTQKPLPAIQGLSKLDWVVLGESLSLRTLDEKEWKRRKAAEALIPDVVEPHYFLGLLDAFGRRLLTADQLGTLSFDGKVG